MVARSRQAELFVAEVLGGQRLYDQYDSRGDVLLRDGSIVDVKTVDVGAQFVNAGAGKGPAHARPQFRMIVVMYDDHGPFIIGWLDPDRLVYSEPPLPTGIGLVPQVCWWAPISAVRQPEPETAGTGDGGVGRPTAVAAAPEPEPKRRPVFGVDRDPATVERLFTDRFSDGVGRPGAPRSNPMLTVGLGGPGPADRTCSECVHLVVQSGLANRRLKCERRSTSHSAQTDHRAGWPACGWFDERPEELS